MSFDAILQRFTEQAPVATMVRAAMTNILSPRELVRRTWKSPCRRASGNGGTPI